MAANDAHPQSLRASGEPDQAPSSRRTTDPSVASGGTTTSGEGQASRRTPRQRPTSGPSSASNSSGAATTSTTSGTSGPTGGGQRTGTGSGGTRSDQRSTPSQQSRNQSSQSGQRNQSGPRNQSSQRNQSAPRVQSAPPTPRPAQASAPPPGGPSPSNPSNQAHQPSPPPAIASHPPHPRRPSHPVRGGRPDEATKNSPTPAKPTPPNRLPARRVSEPTLQWTCDAVGAGSLIASLRLMSVSSTMLHTVDVFDAVGVTHHLALRRFHNRNRLDHDPWYSPANEATVLDLLGPTRVPAPRLLSADITPTVCDLPTLLTTKVPGEPPGSPVDLESFLYGLAHALSVIHTVPDPGPQALPSYRPYFDPAIDGERRPPAWSPRAKLWERVFETIEAPAPATGFGFIHRDYHPGQTLWNDDRLVGVVDWTTGCRGPYAIDLSRMRLNLAGRFGVDVAQRFADLHHEISGFEMVHPYWDLVDAADVLVEMSEPESPSENFEYARFEDWVAQAVSALG